MNSTNSTQETTMSSEQYRELVHQALSTTLRKLYDAWQDFLKPTYPSTRLVIPDKWQGYLFELTFDEKNVTLHIIDEPEGHVLTSSRTVNALATAASYHPVDVLYTVRSLTNARNMLEAMKRERTLDAENVLKMFREYVDKLTLFTSSD